MTGLQHSRHDILIVEDNAGDVLLVQESLMEVETRLHVAVDGLEALAFLRQEGKYADVPRPDLILLDLNLPRKDGREVLAEIKADADLKVIPVIILTSSRALEDIITTYRLHANSYISKPTDLDEYLDALKTVQQYWFRTTELPPE
jgi:two-component system, chemotaxis family, response regulator Rcp1